MYFNVIGDVAVAKEFPWMVLIEANLFVKNCNA